MDDKKDIKYGTDDSATVNQADYFSFLLGKAEKLSSAVYLVTSLISDMEPMKWIMRERGLSLMSDISAAEHAPLSDRMILFEGAEETAREMSSLTSIARAGQIISSMNADILIAAFDSLREAIGRGGNIPTSAESIVAELLRGENKPHLKHLDTYKRQMDMLPASHRHDMDHLAPTNKRTENDAKGHFHLHSRVIKSSEETKASRRKIIVDFVRKKREVTIKDVLQVVSGCSEKTIQRELTTLVKDNVLKKEGERRWSRYLLK